MEYLQSLLCSSRRGLIAVLLLLCACTPQESTQQKEADGEGDSSQPQKPIRLVYPDGYLLTAARILGNGENLVVVPPSSDEVFTELTRKEVSPVPAELIAQDKERDVALVKLKPDMKIQMPEGILGSAENEARGVMLMSLGVPFGYYRIHSVFATQSILSGRIKSHTGTKLLIFDRRVQYGEIGGPLVSVPSGRVIGVIGGVFDPLELVGKETSADAYPINPDLSYASSIEYGAELLNRTLRESSGA